MSRYAVYELFGNSSAPGNLVSCGYLAGSLVGTCDDNPLYRHPNTPDKFKSWKEALADAEAELGGKEDDDGPF